MQLNGHDMAVIEQALREAINQGADYYKIATYQNVLGKMKEMKAPIASVAWETDEGAADADAFGSSAGTNRPEAAGS